MSLATAVLPLALAFAAPALQPPANPHDPIARHLFPPELLMQHSDAIGLTLDQRETIKSSIHAAQSEFIDLQWEMKTRSGELVELLGQHPVDEEAVLAQVDRVLDLERRIKRAQLSLLIRIKNTLSEEQQRELESLR